MNAPTLFDGMVRASDPETSALAAAAVKPGCKECIDAIRVAVQVLATPRWPMSAFDIADQVEVDHPNRWDEGTIRRRVKDAGLTKVDRLGESPRGQACDRFTL